MDYIYIPTTVNIKPENNYNSSEEEELGMGLFDGPVRKNCNSKPGVLTVSPTLFKGKKRTYHVATKYIEDY